MQLNLTEQIQSKRGLERGLAVHNSVHDVVKQTRGCGVIHSSMLLRCMCYSKAVAVPLVSRTRARD